MRIKRSAPERRTSADGIVFDSLSELKRWDELRLLERAGEIRELRRQVRFPLEINGRPILIRSPRYMAGRRCSYAPDFTYYDAQFPDILTVEEHKGVWTDAARLRVAVAEAVYGFRVFLTGPAAMVKRRSSGKRP